MFVFHVDVCRTGWLVVFVWLVGWFVFVFVFHVVCVGLGGWLVVFVWLVVLVGCVCVSCGCVSGWVGWLVVGQVKRSCWPGAQYDRQ